ncbi:hypothetical protein [Candidatus Venteria ishoeyi]|uniref:Uncharacterized protein n=1 Tax=Candidatus Venteria ishoeyi TaxID=1899563 RepID=A0A1H6F5F0_9GAMM|nr:hypothetical protein [Candidatus Venteria ishoeyi]SEH05360.1 Uncharacterised protein [Candidatus Venteria ishoeyi]
MKKFISKIVLFFLVPLISMLIVLSIYFYRVHKLRIQSNVSTVICGDSHTQSALNDNFLHEAINISQQSEHYFYTYNVLKFVLKNNPHLNKVIMGVSFHSFGTGNDRFVFDNKQAIKMYPKYFPILDNQSLRKIIWGNISGILNSGVMLSKYIGLSFLKNYNIQDYPFIGYYYNSPGSSFNDTTIDRAISRHYYMEDNREQEISIFQKNYLNKIIDLCINQNVQLILINTPISSEYYEKIPDRFIIDYYSTISQFENKILFWDFYSYPLEQKSFGDGDHLNYYGAEKFSMKIDSLLIQSTLLPVDLN